MEEQTQGILDRASKGPVVPPLTLDGIVATVAETVSNWPGVISTAHWDLYDSSRIDGIDFYVGEDELGHIHLDGSIHLATHPSGFGADSLLQVSVKEGVNTPLRIFS